MSHVTSNVLYVDDGLNGWTNPGGFYDSSFTSVTVESGGTFAGATLTSGGSLTIQSGGTVLNNTFEGGTLTVENGGALSNITISSAATAIFLAGPNEYYYNVNLDGGTISAFNSTPYFNWGSNGGTLILESGSVDTEGENPSSGNANIIVNSGAVLSGTTLASGNTLTVNSGGSVTGAIINSGATAVFSAGANENATLNGGVISAYNSPPYFTWGSSGGTLILESGAIDTNESPFSGNASIIVNSGAQLSSSTLSSGNTLTVNSGGSLANTTINSGATAVFSAGAIESSAVFLDGGVISAYNSPPYLLFTTSGGTLILESGAVDTYENPPAGNANIYVNSGATLQNTTISSGNTLEVKSGGVVSTLTVTSSGGAGVQGVTSSATVSNGGVLEVASGGTIANNTVESGGSLYARDEGVIGTTTVSSGGSLYAFSGGVISGNVTAERGAQVTIPSTAGGTVTLTGDGNSDLIITGNTSPTTVISGFTQNVGTGAVDSITLESVKANDVKDVTYPDADHVTFTLQDNSSITLNIIGVEEIGYTLSENSDGDLVYEVCFLADTLIATPNGTMAVQDLKPGDVIVSYQDGKACHTTVTWAGKAHCTVKSEKSDDEAGYPVRILQDAIAPGVPFKDLLVTAEHCLFFDNAFIPARMLVNGRSVFYDRSVPSYDYYHIETEDHSVIMADGMLTESYLDTGNRNAFRQQGNVFIFNPQTKSWENDAAAPLDVSRERVEPIYRQIAQRAEKRRLPLQTLPPALTTETNLHLRSANGHIIQPLRTVDKCVMFMIPDGLDTVQIVSNSSKPSDTRGPFVDDRRNLGVLIGEVLFFEGNKKREIIHHLTDDALNGWYGIAHPSARWTNGNASLPLGPRKPGSIGLLSLSIEAAGPYCVTQDEEGKKTA
ncbi:Hint domain-containing protein [Acetobacter thailandicus]|uniref:Hint domain-containing protein n=1 Tax=Acetobacter thailandicus TaxID=1502842 RepID=UPI001BAA7731|nr:Hint domain-containing protein [Acetobacter thailandicus]MBS0979569.1 Hint domain-containing protein [Acetobacter thailandicus]